MAASFVVEMPLLHEIAVRFRLHRACAGGRMEHFLPAMSDSRYLGTELAAKVGRVVDMVGKHLRVLRGSGAADWRTGEGTRLTFYFIPARFRPQPGVVDHGIFKFLFPSAALCAKD